MKEPGPSGRKSARVYLISCISFMGLGILSGNVVGGSVGSSAAMLLVALGAMFGLFYLREVRR